MQTIGLLGSTGSIGINTIDVISRFPDKFKVEFLSTHSSIDLLLRQVKRFRPKAVSIVDRNKASEFKKFNRIARVKIYEGEEGLCRLVEEIKVDTLVVGIVGSSALLPILSSLHNIKRLALANKEALVMAGNIIMRKVRKNNVKILPIDSEHSAIFQCIESNDAKDVRKIYITSSGGPLRCVQRKSFRDITAEKAINHPKWKMGKKISIDSATMMNKGLEVIEAHHLFGMDVDKIDVLIHPQTVIHSMVEFVDGSILGQFGMCDMRMPIQYALTYPKRFSSPVSGLSFSKLKELNFELPDLKKFPCLGIAYESARKGGTYPCVLNASNEVAVGEFLKGRIRFTDIPNVIEKVLGLHREVKEHGIEEILEVDEWARRKTKERLLNRNL